MGHLTISESIHFQGIMGTVLKVEKCDPTMKLKYTGIYLSLNSTKNNAIQVICK